MTIAHLKFRSEAGTSQNRPPGRQPSKDLADSNSERYKSLQHPQAGSLAPGTSAWNADRGELSDDDWTPFPAPSLPPQRGQERASQRLGQMWSARASLPWAQPKGSRFHRARLASPGFAPCSRRKNPGGGPLPPPSKSTLKFISKRRNPLKINRVQYWNRPSYRRPCTYCPGYLGRMER